MDIVLRICVSDGEDISIDGFDEISFYDKLPIKTETETGYVWHRDRYSDLMNALVEHNFIEIVRKDNNDTLEYRDNLYAFNNGSHKENKPLVLSTNSITTIIKEY